MLKFIKHKNLKATFPNVSLALRIILSLHVTVCEAERSLSKMKLVKSERRATMSQDKLNCLAIMSIESYLTRVIDFEDVVSQFAAMNA